MNFNNLSYTSTNTSTNTNISTSTGLHVNTNKNSHHTIVDRLNNISNSHLISYFNEIVRSERKITRQVLECILEIDKRKIYLEKHHTCLFEYLIQEFGYSPGAAMRRIDGARLLKELPEVAEKFENGSLTLSQATQVQRAAREFKKIKSQSVSALKKRELVLSIENSSQKQTEKTLAEALDIPIVSVQKQTFHKDNSVTLTITFTEKQMEALEQAQNMLAHSIPNKNWADMLTFLAEKEIARRTNKTSQGKVSKVVHPSKSIDAHRKNCETYTTLLKRRAIPIRVRKKLLHSKAVCEYIDSQGVSCSSARFLQIDHIKSWSCGGSDDEKNLQVLCGVHNRLKYFKERHL